MHALTVTDVRRIATEAARAQSANVQIVGVTVGGAEGDYAEVIIDIAGCRKMPCRVSLSVFRDVSAAALQQEITDKLRTHLLNHPY